MATVLISIAMLTGCRGPGSSSEPAPVMNASRQQFVYEIDLDRAIDDQHRVMKRDLEAMFDAKKVRATVRVSVEGIVVTAEDITKKAEIRALIEADYGDLIEIGECTDICFHLSKSHAAAIKKAALVNAVTTIRNRLDALKMHEPSVTTRGEQIVIEVDAGENRLNTLVARTGKLEFKVVDSNSDFMRGMYALSSEDPQARDLQISGQVDQWRTEDTGEISIDYYFLAAERTNIEKYFAAMAVRDPRYKVPDDRQIGYGPIEGTDGKTYWRSYYLERAVQLTGADVANAVGATDPNTNRPLVLVDFNRAGSEALADITTRNVGHKLATVLDDQVRSAPIINGPIKGGRVSIAMGGTDPVAQEKERDDLVNVLKTGSLPAPLRQVSP